MIDEIRSDVLEACGRADNLLTPAFFDRHLEVVAAYARELADALGADREIVELAAWLHDISAVLDLGTLPTHAADSAQLGARMLRARGYLEERAARVAEAIGAHVVPLARGQGSLEAVCLSNADAMAQIAMPAFWLFFAFTVRRLSYDDGLRWYAGLVRQRWEQLIPEARARIEPEHELAMTLAQAVSPTPT